MLWCGPVSYHHYDAPRAPHLASVHLSSGAPALAFLSLCSTATMRSTAALAFLSLCGPPIVGATLVQELRFVTDAKEIIGKEGGDIVVIGLFGSSVRCECVVRAPSWERAYLGSTLVHDWLPCVLAGLG